MTVLKITALRCTMSTTREPYKTKNMRTCCNMATLAKNPKEYSRSLRIFPSSQDLSKQITISFGICIQWNSNRILEGDYRRTCIKNRRRRCFTWKRTDCKRTRIKSKTQARPTWSRKWQKSGRASNKLVIRCIKVSKKCKLNGKQHLQLRCCLEFKRNLNILINVDHYLKYRTFRVLQRIRLI